MARKFPRRIKRVVIKIGSSSIATHKLKPSMAQLKSISSQISQLVDENIEVALVSSGAIVLGLGELNKKTRIVGLDFLQAAAAIGQTVLMRTYSDLFSNFNKKCAQILLTWDDFDNRSRFNNAKKTIESLFLNKAVPVINENDTISNEEIRFGDNDKLAAMVASMIKADLLILLSDVDGFYKNFDGANSEVLEEVQEITQEISDAAGGTKKKLFAKGGMSAKLDAILIASHANVPTVIANSLTENVIARIINKEPIGTFFVEKSQKMVDRKHWISFGAKPKGAVFVDDGAKNAVLKGGKSLLLPGICKWEGHFKKGEVLIVRDIANKEIARGISNYDDNVLQEILKDSKDKRGIKEVIHCDNLVLSER